MFSSCVIDLACPCHFRLSSQRTMSEGYWYPDCGSYLSCLTYHAKKRQVCHHIARWVTFQESNTQGHISVVIIENTNCWAPLRYGRVVVSRTDEELISKQCNVITVSKCKPFMVGSDSPSAMCSASYCLPDNHTLFHSHLYSKLWRHDGAWTWNNKC